MGDNEQNNEIFKQFMKKYNINDYYIAFLILLFGLYFVYIKYMEIWIVTRETIEMYANIDLR